MMKDDDQDARLCSSSIAKTLWCAALYIDIKSTTAMPSLPWRTQVFLQVQPYSYNNKNIINNVFLESTVSSESSNQSLHNKEY